MVDAIHAQRPPDLRRRLAARRRPARRPHVPRRSAASTAGSTPGPTASSTASSTTLRRCSPRTVSAAGDAVHLCLRNSPAFIAIWLATARLGAWMVPVDPASSSRDIATQLARVSPTIGFYAAARAETYLAGVAEGGALRTVALEETAADVRPGGRLHADERPARRRGSRRAGRPARRDVHLRHHVAAQGRRADPGQLPPRGRGHGGRGEPRRRRPVAGHPAAVPRERPVLLLRAGDPRGRLRRPHRHVLGEPVDRHGERARRHARQPLRRSHPHDPGAHPGRHRALRGCATSGSPRASVASTTAASGSSPAPCRASCTG